MSTEEVRIPGLYYTVIDGTFRTKVDANHPQAVMREYETREGAKATKYERVVNSLTGFIEDIIVRDSDFGKQLEVKLDKNAEGKNPILQFGVETSYGDDILKKLPAINYEKEVKIRPYAFTDDDGKDVRGVAVTQLIADEDVPVKNFFYDPEKKENVNGYPIPDGNTDEYSKEDWKIYFLQARKFVLAYIAEYVIPKVQTTKHEQSGAPDYPKEEINPEDVPF